MSDPRHSSFVQPTSGWYERLGPQVMTRCIGASAVGQNLQVKIAKRQLSAQPLEPGPDSHAMTLQGGS